MTSFELAAILIVFAYFALQVGFLLRAILRPHREPSSRVAWVLLMLAVPTFGMIAYVLFGETNIGRRRARRYRLSARHRNQPDAHALHEVELELVEAEHRHLFRFGHSISGHPPVGGNNASLLADSDATIDSLVTDIDSARESVHLLFYIWLGDRCGIRIVEAVKRAARRGVSVRIMVDDLGSRKLIRSSHWNDMIAAGVDAARALPVRNPLLYPFAGRIDLRNHRKIVVIDNCITYCGSQNCAAPEFLIKRKYAPWVDLMVRFEGPVARQNQSLFLHDWLAHKEGDLSGMLELPPIIANGSGAVCQVIGTGPTVRTSAMPETFDVLIHAARDELVITTPYYVPTDSIQSALCAAAHRGVRTSMVFPQRNDSRIVAAASRSYYRELLEAGVRIFEFPHGLLHAKSLTFDGQITLIGSANLDRRSFDLNFENNILIKDRNLSEALRGRQREYIAASQEVLLSDVEVWGIRRRLWSNAIGMLGPVL